MDVTIGNIELLRESSIIGHSVPRIDGVEKATGSAVFVNDLKMTGMLHARVLRSPYPHAKVKNVNIEKAKNLAGVQAVICGTNIPAIPYGVDYPDELPLAKDKVRFIGDEVAAVAALDEDVAEEAIQLIEVDYEELPPVFDMEAAMRPDAPLIHDDAPQNIRLVYAVERGNIERGFSEAAEIVELEFKTQSAHAGYMEPRGCVALFEPSGKVTVWSCAQSLYHSRKTLSQALGISPSRIRYVQPYVGGGFGGKMDASKEVVIATLLSRECNKPVRFVLSRSDDLAYSRPLVAGHFKVRLGAKKDGTFVAKQSRVLADNGAYSCYAFALVGVMASRIDNLYRFQHIKSEGHLVYTNKTPTGALRGFGNPQGTFAVESCIDQLADKLGLDPLEVRMKNATQPGETTIHGWRVSSCGFSDCLKKAAEKSGWFERKARKTVNRGLGMAGVIHVCGNRVMFDFDGSSAVVRVNEDGRVTVITAEGDIGQGARTAYAMIAAETLGARYEDVDVTMADTDFGPYCLGYYASRGIVTAGNAIRIAASDARKQLLECAARLLEAKPDELEARGGAVFVKGLPGAQVSFEQISRAAIYHQGGGPIIGKGIYDAPSEPLDRKTKYGHVAPTYSFGAQVAEVEVDRETGIIKVLHIWAAEDGGRILHPASAEGQVEGALGMGFGFTMMEELKWDEGKILNPTLLDYKMPTTEDVPLIHHDFVLTEDPFGPFGAKAMSESPGVPTPAAIANAVYDAIGVRISELPIAPAKVLAVLKKKRKSGEI